jgi:hypothetical protein
VDVPAGRFTVGQSIFDEYPKLEIHIPIPAFTPEKDGIPQVIKDDPNSRLD